MTLIEIFGLLVTHYIADFLCQNQRMRLNKSTSIRWLTGHALVYGWILFAAATWMVIAKQIPNPYNLVIGFWAINTILHWITDFGTSKWTAWLWKKERSWWFFNIVYLDQLIHYACLFITYQYFFK